MGLMTSSDVCSRSVQVFRRQNVARALMGIKTWMMPYQ
jgi:hypothetical protein